jgi:serine/threonine-protein kinase
MEELGIDVDWGPKFYVLVDINQPGESNSLGTYQDGPIIGRMVDGRAGQLIEGTLLHGRIWTGPGIYNKSNPPSPAAVIRYTQAVLPDGRKYPVCIVVGGNPESGVVAMWGEYSKPGAAVLNRVLPAGIIKRWQ